jgi:hypothetical protein
MSGLAFQFLLVPTVVAALSNIKLESLPISQVIQLYGSLGPVLKNKVRNNDQQADT